MAHCSVSACPNVEHSLGLCSAHKYRLRNWGDVRADEPIGTRYQGRPRPVRWFCECGPKEQFDGLECTRCGRRPRRVMERSA